MNDHPVAAATGSDSSPRRASRSASARDAPARSSRCSAIISGTAAGSLTGTTLATIPVVPSGISELASPSTSSAPAGAATPESQLGSTSQRGPRRSRSRSYTVSGPSSSRSEENSGLSARNVPCAAMCASPAPSIASRTRATVAVPPPSTTGATPADVLAVAV